ncbi:MAG: ASKHA domain-containing protein [Coriobacteriia bacterium]|nr:ASKHA domain-containing protein [Coriobacteriia bacterium]
MSRWPDTPTCHCEERVARRGNPVAYGIAVDLGTTSVSLALAQLAPGAAPRVLASASARNAQASEFGRDILSRLSAATGGAGSRLRDLAQNQVIELLACAAGRSGLELAEITPALSRAVIAGNSAMAALLVGADVASLATAPFAPVRTLRCDAGPLARLLGPQRITVLEPLDAFVGGDVRADLIATDLVAEDASGPRLLIDLGTNAEVVLARGPHLFVCSAPAGPAFEGGGSKLLGSEVLADVAQLLRQGVIGRDGKLDERNTQVRRDQGGVAQVSGPRSGQALSQRFIRDLQLAKAATSTALAQTLDVAGLRAADIVSIDIAGAFGSALVPADLATLGLIPAVWQDRTHSRGNASLAGALAVLGGASPELSRAVKLIAIALPDDPAFNAALIAATDFNWRH